MKDSVFYNASTSQIRGGLLIIKQPIVSLSCLDPFLGCNSMLIVYIADVLQVIRKILQIRDNGSHEFINDHIYYWLTFRPSCRNLLAHFEKIIVFFFVVKDLFFEKCFLADLIHDFNSLVKLSTIKNVRNNRKKQFR